MDNVYMYGMIQKAYHQYAPYINPQKDILVIIPAYNERANLKILLHKAPKQVLGRKCHILVVDDGSSDYTKQIAMEYNVCLLRIQQNQGGGYALYVGFTLAQKLGMRCVVTMDADGQHCFTDLPSMVWPILFTRVDLVIGNRFLRAGTYENTTRRLGIVLFNFLLFFLLKTRISDCSNGYRSFSYKAINTLHCVEKRHHTAEVLIQAVHKNLQIKEVPVVVYPRQYGNSKKGPNFLYGLRFGISILKSWYRV